MRIYRSIGNGDSEALTAKCLDLALSVSSLKCKCCTEFSEVNCLPVFCLPVFCCCFCLFCCLFLLCFFFVFFFVCYFWLGNAMTYSVTYFYDKLFYFSQNNQLLKITISRFYCRSRTYLPSLQFYDRIGTYLFFF